MVIIGKELTITFGLETSDIQRLTNQIELLTLDLKEEIDNADGDNVCIETKIDPSLDNALQNLVDAIKSLEELTDYVWTK